MGSPYHISDCVSSRFFKNKASAEYEALSVISDVFAHPQRTVLTAFILQAVDRESASRFFLQEVSRQDKATIFEFYTDWVRLIEKVRPVVVEDLDPALKQNVWRREGAQCCISKVKDGNKNGLVLAYILPPSLLHDDEMVREGKIFRLLAAFIGESQMRNLCLLIDPDILSSSHDVSNQLILVSMQMFEHLRNGRVSLERVLFGTTNDSLRFAVDTNMFLPCTNVVTPQFIVLDNKAAGLASLPSTYLLEIHHRFAEPFAWLEASSYMKQMYSKNDSSLGVLPTKTSLGQYCLQSVPRIFKYLWVRTPVLLRALTYRSLATISVRLYGYTGSDRTFRLPCNLYMRVASSDWATKHQAEFQTLQLVENYTRIPAPRAIDTLQYSDSSFLLMAGLPGKRVGVRLSTMTDEQVNTVVQDLKEYITELRQIPNKTGSSFQICNALGGGILDWRIGDSQRKELKFRDETEFNKYLAYDLPLDEAAWTKISKSHGVKHELVFTHADLNLRNILVDENGKISGIVDWECAGWYPEYWEYTKAHFSVRFTVRWIADVIDQVFDKYRIELQVEDMLSSMVPSW